MEVDADWRAIRIQASQASMEAKRPLRRPACFRVDGVPLLHFRRTLTRCPHTLVAIQPPAGSQSVTNENEVPPRSRGSPLVGW